MSFYYLASPYSKFAGGIDAAFRLACEQTALLNRAGVDVFSPIVHSHAVAVHGGLDTMDHDLWMRLDQPFMDAARGCIFLLAEGWRESKGMAIEFAEFKYSGKSVIEMTPGIVPELFKRHAHV